MKFSDYHSVINVYHEAGSRVGIKYTREVFTAYGCVCEAFDADVKPGTAEARQINEKLRQLDNKYGMDLPTLSRKEREAFLAIARVAAMEKRWADAGRPYYNIWPSMLEVLQNCNLTGIYGRQLVLPVPALLLRMPGEHGAILVRQSAAAIVLAWSPMTVKDDAVRVQPIRSDVLLLDALNSGNKDDGFYEVARAGMSMVAAVAMLRENPDIIQPLPLNADAFRYAQTQDPALITKAKRKGLFGFDVGRTVESAPGFRRPHFGIRHKGRGRTIPELVPIRGCMVKKKVIMEVPTGYLDEEDTAKGDET